MASLFPEKDAQQTESKKSKAAEKPTPAMAQWFELKDRDPDALLFFQLGDFYEMFFEDAIKASEALDIALTHRGKHLNVPVPMCGVPLRSANIYLARLVRQGFKVAIADQTKSTDKKGLFTRAVTRVVTPGTTLDEEILTANLANILLAVSAEHSGRIGVAWADFSTGNVEIADFNADDKEGIQSLLRRLRPVEIVADENILHPQWDAITTHDDMRANLKECRALLQETYDVASYKSLGQLSDCQTFACARLLAYLAHTNGVNRIPLSVPKLQDSRAQVFMDGATRASLAITPAHPRERAKCLLATIDYTVTHAGARLTDAWLSAPITDLEKLNARQEGWVWLKKNPVLLDRLTNALKGSPDLIRAWRRAGGNKPLMRDLQRIKSALRTYFELRDLLRDRALPEILSDFSKDPSQNIVEILTLLSNSLPDESLWEEGERLITEGFSPELDRALEAANAARRAVTELEIRLRETHGVNALKIKKHNQLGFLIEVPHKSAAPFKADPKYALKQGTASLSRFITDELLKLAHEIEINEIRLKELEDNCFAALCDKVVECCEIRDIADRLALSDVLCGLARLAGMPNWCRPALTRDTDFDLKQCWHPVVVATFRKNKNDADFIPNDCELSPDKRLMLLTGPNMAGKSTYLRQTALAIVLAQAGMPVCATSAKIGIVDKIFSRIGGADDLVEGQSTFMVEMCETASILNQATDRSFIIIDEIGRGTSTGDGLAIAWAVLETLHDDIGARAIFATHFHELAQLRETLNALQPTTFKIREWNGKVVFQHTLKAGYAEKSWGLHVARLAGLPEKVLGRARAILANPSKAQAPQSQSTPENSELAALREKLQRLKNLDADNLTPKQALDALYALKEDLT